MMAQKRLDEMLREDQEPFQLKNYIADRKTQLWPSSVNQLQQVKKRKPISQTPNFPGKFCKNACFFSFHDSPDLRKSPLFDFASPAAKSPCRSPKNAIFLHIPARTTALLLEAALRIQKQSKSTQTPKNHGSGLFGSILKRLTNRNRKREIESAEKVSVKDILRWDSKSRGNFQKSGRCSCNGSSPSSAVWSETNEHKNLEELETSSSSQSDHDSTEILSSQDIESIGDFGFCEGPFRFVLQRSPSSDHRTPEFFSPSPSPSRPKTEEKEQYDAENLKKSQGDEGEEEEEKEQCSPVSVLDAPFEDDEEGNKEDEDDDDSFDIEGSYAIVQRAKQKLLQKLQRFERLAGLDPIELEKRMLENEEEEDEDADDNVDNQDEDQECGVRFHEDWQIPKYMRLLVSDLIAEEEKQEAFSNDQEMMKRVLERLESWKDVESNTIDMMVDQDFRREYGLWMQNLEQVKETAAEIELAIFGHLVEELWD